jgi:putative transposase
MKAFYVLPSKVLSMARAWVGAYVLMPDHLHAFVAIDDQKLNLSTWAKSLKNSISKTLRQDGIAPPHWQKTFFDHLLRSAESYTEKWHYVRENPVRAGLVSQWEEWPFRGEVSPLEYRSES